MAPHESFEESLLRGGEQEPVQEGPESEVRPLENRPELRDGLIEELGRWRRMVGRLGTAALVVWGVNTEAFKEVWNSDLAQKHGLPKLVKIVEEQADKLEDQIGGYPKVNSFDDFDNLLKGIEDKVASGQLNQNQLETLKIVFDDLNQGQEPEAALN